MISPAQAGAHPEKSALAIRNGGMSVPIIPVRTKSALNCLRLSTSRSS